MMYINTSKTQNKLYSKILKVIVLVLLVNLSLWLQVLKYIIRQMLLTNKTK